MLPALKLKMRIPDTIYPRSYHLSNRSTGDQLGNLAQKNRSSCTPKRGIPVIWSVAIVGIPLII